MQGSQWPMVCMIKETRACLYQLASRASSRPFFSACTDEFAILPSRMRQTSYLCQMHKRNAISITQDSSFCPCIRQASSVLGASGQHRAGYPCHMTTKADLDTPLLKTIKDKNNSTISLLIFSKLRFHWEEELLNTLKMLLWTKEVDSY